MAGLYAHWRTRGLNLDHFARTYPSRDYSVDPDRGLSRRKLWLLIRTIFMQVLCDRACAVHLFQQPDGSFRMLYCFAQQGDTWYEMVPPPGIIGCQMVNALRKQAGLDRGRVEGPIHYLLGGLQTAAYVSRSPKDLCVYFSHHRPRPLDKESGDTPGQSTSDAKETPADLPCVPAGIRLSLCE